MAKCEFCKHDLNIGKRFCSKECYRLWRMKPGFQVPNAHKFTKGRVYKRMFTEEQKAYVGKLSRLGVIGMKNKQHSNTTKELMKQKATGRKHSEQTKLKISLIQRDIKRQYWNELASQGYEFITPKDKLERHRFRNEIQKLVLERDDYTCQMCGSRGGYLQVDHILSWSEHVELRFDINNCRTLCMDCHYKITFGREKPKEVTTWGHNFSQEGC